ncbi:EAL domain-containing protein (putative c-di-GMP-specific phosphodiesterase class I) [Bradyrhizobium sp. USDA 4501]
MTRALQAEASPIVSVHVRILNARHILAAYGGAALSVAIASSTRTVSWILGGASAESSLAAGEHEIGRRLDAPNDYLIRFNVRISDACEASSLLDRILRALAVESIVVDGQEILIAPAVECFPFANADGNQRIVSHPSEPARVERPFAGRPVRAEAGWREQYREEMTRAADFFDHLTGGRLVLARQAIKEHRGAASALYDECLLRIVDHDGAARSCASEIVVLERLGLIRAVDDHVFGLAIKQLRSDPTLRLGINVSAQSACLDEWWKWRFLELEADRPLAKRLTIELTETAGFPAPAVAVAFVRRLRELGCAVALDDLGAGEHALRDLFELDPDVVKVDGHFLRWARKSPRGQAALRSMVRLSLAIGSIVVVEGVESQVDSDLASEAGAQWQQGYFIERPRCEFGNPDVISQKHEVALMSSDTYTTQSSSVREEPSLTTTPPYKFVVFDPSDVPGFPLRALRWALPISLGLWAVIVGGIMLVVSKIS